MACSDQSPRKFVSILKKKEMAKEEKARSSPVPKFNVADIDSSKKSITKYFHKIFIHIYLCVLTNVDLL